VQHFFSLDVSHNVSWTQPCKRASTARILDFFWTVPDNLLMVTTTGVELYQLPLPDAPKVRIALPLAAAAALKAAASLLVCSFSLTVIFLSVHRSRCLAS
jgi:hypothetical protein